jgi:hypothetical protein
MSNDYHHTIWVVEYRNVNGKTGGLDWFYNFEQALSHFLTTKISLEMFGDNVKASDCKTYELGMYSLSILTTWSTEKINTWVEDNCNILISPVDTMFPTPIAPDF